MEDIVILGFGGHAKSVADSISKSSVYRIAGYTDMSQVNSLFTYLGDDSNLSLIFDKGIHNAAIGVGFMGNSYVRDSLVKLAKDIGFTFPIIIDPSASVACDVSIGEGVYIGKNAVVNAGSIVGNYSIVNTGSIVEHDNIIGDYSHIAVGAVLCGDVTVGNHSFIGAGTTVIQGIRIGSNSIIGASSTVLKNISDNNQVCGIVK